MARTLGQASDRRSIALRTNVPTGEWWLAVWPHVRAKWDEGQGGVAWVEGTRRRRAQP